MVVITIDYLRDMMLKKQREALFQKIKANQFLLIFTDQKIDIANILLPEIPESNIIRYLGDDKLYTNHTKLMDYFKINAREICCDGEIHAVSLGISEKKKQRFFFIANIVRKIINFLRYNNMIRMRMHFRHVDFTDKELGLLTKIKKAAKNGVKFLLIKNINNANQADLSFFRKILSCDFLPQKASSLKIIMTSSAMEINDVSLLEEAKRKNSLIYIHLGDDDLLEYFREHYPFCNLPEDKIRQYLKICGDNVFLLSLILNQAGHFEGKENITTLLRKSICEILNSMPDASALEFAAIVGISYDILSLHQISEIELDVIQYQSEEAYSKGIVLHSEGNNTFEFIDELVHDIVYRHGRHQTSGHKRYADFLNLSNPYEYLIIAKHYYYGECIDYFIVFYFAYIMKYVIKKNCLPIIPTDIEEILISIRGDFTLNFYLSRVQNLINEYLEGTLNSQELFIKEEGAVSTFIEKYIDYLKLYLAYQAKLVFDKESYEKLAENLRLSYIFLEKAKILGEQIDCALVLLDIYSYRSPNKSECVKITHNLEILHAQIRSVRTQHDYNIILKLTRKLASVKNPESAFIMTKNLFQSCKSSDFSFDEIEYYKYINDFLGYALYSGNYTELSEDIEKEVENYILVSQDLSYPKSYKLWMNYYIYRLYRGRLDQAEIVHIIKKWTKEKSISSTMFRFDIAAFALLTNQLRIAENILLQIKDQIQFNITCFYDYCVNSNLTSLYLLKGDFESAKQYNDQILEKDYEWEIDFISIMKKRAQILNSAIEQRIHFVPKNLFEYFDHLPLFCSSVWNFLGKGIIFSELMFYRE